LRVASRQKVLSIAGWTVVWLMTLMLVYVFGTQGFSKFSDSSGWARAFASWGYPVWFRVLIGVMEVGAAALLLWPRTAPMGAVLIIMVMLGGMGTHVVKDHGRHMQSEVMPIVFSSVILFARRRSWMPSARLRASPA
jgi:putative oxidoreductase